MIIHLTKSQLFTRDPDDRIAERYHIPPGLWRQIYKKHKFYEYTKPELVEYFLFKTHIQISSKGLYRWVWRTEIYDKAQMVMTKGVQVVKSDFFNEQEHEVINELTKHLKAGKTKDVRTIV